jgi:serine/threonine-protein kinase
MRLVRGGTAERLLADHGALPAAYVVVLLDQLLSALGALHASGLVHRDVKPANLLLEPTGTGRPHVWLGDLGVAAPLGVPSTTYAGTDGYLAPDAESRSPPVPGHDLYATGVTAAELLTGRVPRHERDLPRSPLRGLLADLISVDPGRRPSSAEEARARLRAGGVRGAKWRGEGRVPDVPDRLRRLTLVERWRVQGIRAAQ